MTVIFKILDMKKYQEFSLQEYGTHDWSSGK